MLGVQPHLGPGDPGAITGGLAGVIRAAAPLIERAGVATAEEIGVETFAEWLRDELRTNQAVFAYPMLLSSWRTTKGATPRPAPPSPLACESSRPGRRA
jgi:hypothetical protein